MSQEEISILIEATDEASGVLADAGEQIDSSLNQVSESTSQLSSSVDESMSSIESNMSEAQSAASGLSNSAEEAAASTEDLASSQSAASGGLKTNALAMNNLALSGAGLVMSVSNIENAEVSLDRAHVTLEKDTNAVQAAQEKYNEAVAKYGPNSQQATDAANKLQAAQDALTVAQERVDEAQRNVNNTIMMSSLTIIPSIITAIGSLSTITASWTAIQGAASVAADAFGIALDFLSANPIVLVIAGIAALALGIYEAYEHCGPFRDAINEIGSVLGGAFASAAKDISAALNFLWNDVLVPIADFLKTVFLDAINVVLEPIKLLMDAVNAVSKVGNAIGGAVGGALKSIGLASGGIVTQPTFAMVGEAGPEAVIPLDENFGDALSDVGGAGSSGSAGSIPSQSANTTLQISSPLIVVQGNADKATLDAAVNEMKNWLQTVIIENTSSQSTTKRVRAGSMFS